MPTKQQTARLSVRERILDAALAILGESGIQHLTQPEVAKRAGVRQSHLTYYFPTRDDLLEAGTERGVEHLAAGLGRLEAGGTRSHLIERLAAAIVDRAHMRMFVAMMVEADGDPAVRAVMTRGTQQMEAAVAEALGDSNNLARARVVLAAIWGLGLYQFLIQPGPKADPTREYLSWVTAAASERSSRSRASRSRKR
ncbi:MAG TPA: TetR/AcrR family transcriptional regulator [Vicinamibacterales bacterium]|jgi:AcrR family transcriptional regulator